MSQRLAFMVITVLACSLASAAHAAPITFVVDDPGNHNRASFESRAPIETVPGVTSDVTGTVAFDPDDLTGPVSGRVVVGLASLTTGIDMRDGHMRGERYLDVAKYPTATFVVEKVVSSDKPKLADGETAQIVVAGKFTLHGVTLDVQAPVTLFYKKASPDLAKMGYSGDIAGARSTFDVKLADYGIQRPQFLILKLDEIIHVSVQYTADSGRDKAGN
jgi:polyisoprenoid-binding protein YceI